MANYNNSVNMSFRLRNGPQNTFHVNIFIVAAVLEIIPPLTPLFK